MSFEERLIEEVKCHDIIYNLSSRGYKNVLHKEKVWTDISSRLGVTEERAKKKWRNLRDVYKRTKQKLESSRNPESCNLTWKYFDQMSFLDNVPCRRVSVRSYNDVQDCSTEPSSPELLASPSSFPSTVSSKRARHSTLQDDFYQLVEATSQKIEEACNSTDSTAKLFDALATRVVNAGLTEEETGIVELKVTECVMNTIREIKRNRH